MQVNELIIFIIHYDCSILKGKFLALKFLC